MPSLVLDELQANYKRELEKKLNDYIQDRKRLEAILHDPLPQEPTINPSDEARRYIKLVLQILQIDDERLFSLRPQYLNDVVYRAVNRIHPCSERGEEIRDALIWCCLKEIARELGEGRVLFISANKKEFADASGNLHPSLAEEAANEGLSILYYNKLEDFARDHAVPIDFITAEWLTANIDFSQVVKTVSPKIENALAQNLPTSTIDGYGYTGNTQFIEGNLHIDDFFVNILEDGSYRIEAVLQGNLKFGIEVINIRSEYAVTLSGSSASGLIFPTTFPVTFSGSSSGSSTERNWEYVHPTVKITVEIIVRNKFVEKWEAINFIISSPWRYTVVSE